MLNRNGFKQTWLYHPDTNSNFHVIFKLCLMDQFLHQWRGIIGPSKRFGLLNAVKPTFQRSNYIDTIKSPDVRLTFTRLRVDCNVCSAYSRGKEIGTYTCPLCYGGEDSVKHLLCQCPSFQGKREILFQEITNSLPWWAWMNDSEKLHKLLDTRSPDNTLFNCCTYVHELYVARENVLKHWIYIYIYMPLYVYMSLYVACVYAYLWMYGCVFICIYVCTRTHTHTHTYIYIYIYICTHAVYQGSRLKIRTRVSIYARATQEHRNDPHGVPDVKVIVPSACFHLISFPLVSMCVFTICLYFGKAAFHGCPMKCLSLSLSSIAWLWLTQIMKVLLSTLWDPGLAIGVRCYSFDSGNFVLIHVGVFENEFFLWD